jgi:hypothetical protein
VSTSRVQVRQEVHVNGFHDQMCTRVSRKRINHRFYLQPRTVGSFSFHVTHDDDPGNWNIPLLTPLSKYVGSVSLCMCIPISIFARGVTESLTLKMQARAHSTAHCINIR